ncbi:putative multidrug resistance-associated protein [Talaromyces proteolyticus]|uniref:Multidrug resistance-associated protein n=1 Tax=Talaromyces proteolyticus TaxID=1131652 RepID=A0AAD4Q331_9EURO|nr:putative multidrug resistance-associated protein [Talaromyces proteolyticus]KAH8701001.1 putative multidrug resistance-associated protein [Talaromyces proteolyticus]
MEPSDSIVGALFRTQILQKNSSGIDAVGLFSIGPAADSGFDFTILFEDVFLSILPSALLLVALPLRMFSLQRSRPKVAKGGILHDCKLLFLSVLTAMNLALLGLQAGIPSQRTSVTVATAALVFVTSLGLCVLSRFEHIRSIRPSPIINAYLLLTLVFDIARVRSLFRTNADKSIAACFSSMIGVKVMVLLVEAIEKRDLLLEPYRHLSPEETSGIYSKSFFFWLNQLMTSGFRRLLRNSDLYPIDREMRSEALQTRMQRTWGNTTKVSQASSRALFWAVIKANRRSFFYCIVPRLCVTAFRYTQPFLLTRTVWYASDLSQSESIGWGLTGAFFLVLLGLAVSNGLYYHMNYRFVTSVRGSLISVIYAKTLDLSITALDESVAVTLMSSDTQSICNGFQMIHTFWAVPLEVGIALYLLARQLGLAWIMPAILTLVSAVGILSIAKLMHRAQVVWMQSIQTRVDVTATMLSSMKSVKMLGFTDWLSSIVQGLRVEELKMAGMFRKLLIVRVFFGNLLGTLAPFATFAIFAIQGSKDGRVLTADSAYTALSLISLISSPMNELIRAIPSMNAAMASLNRIQSFLNSDSRRDNRLSLQDLSVGPRQGFGYQTAEEYELVERTPVEADSSAMVLARNVSFSWTQNDEPVVNDVNFSISRGHLCIIIGPIGCGKSTLLKGLLGETLSTKGFLYVKDQEIAFVDQSPWIRNATFQDNILGISAYDEAWYNKVVWACALDQETALPNGHLTKVGSSGISLSGGQKQRLALARAVYARKQVLMLDDVFSGLDADTEERIFTRLLSPQGLLRKTGITVLLVTHAIHRLAYADRIIAMEKGSIAAQGTLAQIEAAGNAVSLLKASTRAMNQVSESDRQQPQETNGIIPEIREDATTTDNGLSRQHGDLSLYAYYLGSVHWSSALVWASCFVLQGVAAKSSEFLVNFWTSAAESQGNSVNGFYLGLYGMLAALSTVALIGGGSHYILYYAPISAKVFHERLLKSVMNAPLAFFTSVDMGITTNRFSQDMTLIDNDLTYSMTDFLLSLSSGIMSAILMCTSARYFAATLPPVLLLMWTLQKFYLRTSRQMRILDLEAKSPLFSQFIESLSGLVTIRSFGWSSTFEKENLVLLDASQKPFYLLYCIQRWLELSLDLMVTGLSVVLMTMIVKLRGEVGAGYVGLGILNVISFSQTLSLILRTWTELETSIGAIARIRDFTGTTANENRPEENIPLPSSIRRSSNSSSNTKLNEQSSWPHKGAIEFRNVSASYGTGDKDKAVIRNLSMSISAGEKIGICGRSGSGKSSLLAVLFRMLEVDAESQITIDGVDITRVPRQQLRAALNAIPQEPFFTRGTVRANADPSDSLSTEEITDALRAVQLWDIVQSKGGLDADLETNFFSHGQRQLFCLARALLRRQSGKVVVLDEVTSNVDLVSDVLMQRVIREQFADCTILAVAHRLDTIMDFDRIAVMRDGELVEFDSPRVLLSRDSAFKELYESL